MYKVIGTTKSRALRVLWLLNELGQPYEHIDAMPRSDEAKAVNPSGKIPVLMDGDTAIPDSCAIMTYLADKHGAFTYAAGTVERALQDALTHQILDELDAVLWTAARHSFVLPEDKRVETIKDPLKWEYARNVDRIMAQRKGPFMMGDQMTIPDMLLTHCAGWAMVAGFPTENAELKAFSKEMRARPAYMKMFA